MVFSQRLKKKRSLYSLPVNAVADNSGTDKFFGNVFVRQQRTLQTCLS